MNLEFYYVDAKTCKVSQDATWPLKGKAQRGSSIAFGTFGLQAVESHYVTSRQIEAARRELFATFDVVVSCGSVFSQADRLQNVPQRPAWVLVREQWIIWVAPVRPGKVIFEMAGIRADQAEEALRLAAFKLPMKTQFISREEHTV